MRLFRRGLVTGLDIIHQTIAIQTHGNGRFRIGFLGEQQTLHVRMLNDRHLWFAEIRIVRVTTLQAIPGVIQRKAVAPIAQHGSPKPDPDPSFIHHLEHVTQPLVGFTDQIAVTIIIITERQRRAGGTAITEFVNQPGQYHVVTFAGVAIRIQAILGNHKQGNAFHAFRTAGYLGEHQMHNILRQLVVTAGDIDLVALEAIAAVILWHRTGADVRQGGAGMGFGQCHGAGKTPRHHRRQKL